MFRDISAENSAAAHAYKLEGLVETVHSAQKFRWRCFLDQMIHRRHQSGHCDAVDKAQKSQLPGCSYKSLGNGNQAGHKQRTKQYLLGADPVRKCSALEKTAPEIRAI